ncbi:MAG: hypothetical protein AAFX40_00400 [Cyanobacteria bacterium J06639_1]
MLCALSRQIRQWAIAIACIAWLWSGAFVLPASAQSLEAAELATESIPAQVKAIPSREEVTQRLQAIADEMVYIKFCNRATCKYKDIEVTISPLSMEKGLYEGEIKAVMDRPSTTIDKARYRFEFDGDRWLLLGGEELSDVSSFLFAGDTYEVYSAYSGRTRQAKLKNADIDLRVGYRDLYYLLMKAGVERIKPTRKA